MMQENFNPENQAGQALEFALNDNVSLLMNWCPPGEFLMGSPNTAKYRQNTEIPHRVKLTQGFWIGQTPVTIALWKFVMGSIPPYHAPQPPLTLPINGMMWGEAREFCLKLTEHLRKTNLIHDDEVIDLPSEAQWEYACRAGTESTWYFGENEAELDNHAWYLANSSKTEHSVAQKLPNPWGMYDFYGNVMEWCLDTSHRYPENSNISIDPIVLNDDEFKVVRGGYCDSPSDTCRSAFHGLMSEYNPFTEAVGFRIVYSKKSSIPAN